MKTKLSLVLPVLLVASMLLTSCEAITGIFKAGMWTGVIGIILVVAIIIWLISKMSGRNKS